MSRNDWDQSIARAQYTLSYEIDGEYYPRLRAEDEWCHDCDVTEGMLHVSGCDQEPCPKCGGQWISCGCAWM